MADFEHKADNKQATPLATMYSALYGRSACTLSLAALEHAITTAHAAISASSSADEARWGLLYALSELLLYRYLILGERSDVENTLVHLRKILPLDRSRVYPLALSSFAHALYIRFVLSGDTDDLTNSISHAREALASAEPKDNSSPRALITLASALLSSYARTSIARELSESLQRAHEAVASCALDSPARIAALHTVSQALRARYEHGGDIRDLDASLAYARQAVIISPSNHPDRALVLATLASILLAQYEHTGRVKDLADSLLLAHKAEALAPPASPHRSMIYDVLCSVCVATFAQDGRAQLLELAMSSGTRALQFRPHRHPDRPRFLLNAASANLACFVVTGKQDHIESSIVLLREALELAPPRSPIRPAALSRLADALRHRFLSCGVPEDLDESIERGREALLLSDSSSPAHAVVLRALASALAERFAYSGEHDEDFAQSMQYFGEGLDHCSCARGAPAYLDLTISFLNFVCGAGSMGLLQNTNLLQATIEDCPPRYFLRPALLSVVASFAVMRYGAGGNPRDLELASSVIRGALASCLPDAMYRPALLLALASVSGARFTRTGDLGDFAQCVEPANAALAQCSPRHPLRHKIYILLAKSSTRRAEQTEDPDDEQKALDYLQSAHALCPLTSPLRPSLVYNLEFAYRKRFQRTEHVEDAGEAIKYARESLSLYPSTHPVHVQVRCDLGELLAQRFSITNNPVDIDESVECLQEALLSPPTDPGLRLKLSSGLANVLLDRYKMTKDDEDIQRSLDAGQTCISHLQEALSLRPGSSSPQVLSSMSLLAEALKERFDLRRQHYDLEECIALESNVLALCPPGHPDRKHTNVGRLAWALRQRFETVGDIVDLDNSILYLRERLKMSSEHNESTRDPSRTLDLAIALSIRFERTRQQDDLEESIRRGHEDLSLCPAGHPTRARTLDVLSAALIRRVQQTGQQEDLSRAIVYLREALALAASDASRRVRLLMNLAGALEMHLRSHASPELAEEVVRLSAEAYSICSSEHPDRVAVVHHLATSYREQYNRQGGSKGGNIEDLTKAIDYYHEALLLSLETSPIHLHRVNDLGDALFLRYLKCARPEDLSECIERTQKVLSLCKSRQDHPERQRALVLLASALWIQYPRTKDQEDIANALLYLRESALAEDGPSLRIRLQAAILWAHVAHSERHPSTLEAYRLSLELSERLLTVAPTLEMQHELIREQLVSLPLDAAAYAISVGDLPLAVEMLEQGRALLWSQVRRLRSPLDRLPDDSRSNSLRDTFLEKSRALEAINTSMNPFFSASSGNEVADPYGAMLETRRRLSAELNEVIEQIRGIVPDFLHLPSYDRIKAASEEGPVIVVNHSKYRSDALILCPDDTIVCVALADDFYTQTIDLANGLLEARQTLRTAPKKYDQALRRALKDLAELLVAPVVEKLRELDVEPGSRIWWCPTSVVSVLPLHAAGPLTTSDAKSSKGKAYLSDLYISSYTATLNALIEAREDVRDRPSQGRTNILGVVLLDKSLEAVGSEAEVLRDRLGDNLTLAMGSGCSREAVIAGLRTHPWAHFACHGTLSPGAPFNSAFVLSGDTSERLTLLDVIKAGLHNAELAVLSACHTAELPVGSALDESLHLAAAMQFAGFRSVVGTMWQLNDEDGPPFADSFYREMLREQDEERETIEIGLKRAARALHIATKELRRRKVALERWVNFVHIGA